MHLASANAAVDNLHMSFGPKERGPQDDSSILVDTSEPGSGDRRLLRDLQLWLELNRGPERSRDQAQFLGPL